MKFLNQKGISLVEGLIAGAMMGGLALVGAKLTSNNLKGTKGVETKFEYFQSLSDIRSNLSNLQACQKTNAGKDITTCTGTAKPTAAPCLLSAGTGYNIKNKSDVSIGIFGGPTPTQKSNLVIYSAAWLNNLQTGGTATGTIDLWVQFENKGFGETSVGSQYTERKITLTVTVDAPATNIIQDCQATSNGQDDIWLNFTDFAGIYYSSGGVVVGTTSDGTIFNGPSLSVGSGNKVTHRESVAMGSANVADFTRGDGSDGTSIAIGTGAEALSRQSMTLGFGSIATQRFGQILGTNSRNNGFGSVILGGWNSNGNPSADNVTGISSTGINGGGHGNVIIGNRNGNPCFDSTHANPEYLMGYHNNILGNSNQSTNNAIFSTIIGNNMKSNARGAMLLGDSSISSVADPADVVHPLCNDAVNSVTVNSVKDSFLARFVGGYTFRTTNTALTAPYDAIFFNKNSQGRAFIGINNAYPNGVYSDVDEPNVFRSNGGTVHLSGPKFGCDPNPPHVCAIGNPELTPLGTDGFWVRNNPFDTGFMGQQQGRTWVGINQEFPSDTATSFEVSVGNTKLKQEAWTVMNLKPIFTPGCNFGVEAPASYKKDSNGFVRFKGAVMGQGVGNNWGILMSPLPAGYIPAQRGHFLTPLIQMSSGPSGNYCRVMVNEGGFIEVSNAVNGMVIPAGFCCMLDGINYEGEL